VRCEVLTAMLLKVQVLCNRMLCVIGLVVPDVSKVIVPSSSAAYSCSSWTAQHSIMAVKT
jgi:hypothetical protein